MITHADRALRAFTVALAAATLTLGMLASCAAVGAAAAVAATTGTPWWRLNVTVAPSLLPHDGEAQIILDATNLGDAAVNAATSPVVLSDTLPNGGEGGVEGVEVLETHGGDLSCTAAAAQLSCTSKLAAILPYQSLYARVRVKTSVPEAVTQLRNTLAIEGGQTPAGGAVIPPAPLQKPLRLAPGASGTQAADQQVPFGVETLEMTPEAVDGSVDAQAGSHPFQFSTTLDLDQTLLDYPSIGKPGVYPSSPALAKELHFKLPPGLVADTTAVPACSYALFTTKLIGWSDPCPADTAVGVAIAEIFPPSPLSKVFHEDIPIFNLEVAPGEPARYGFVIDTVPIVLNATLLAGGDYAAEVSVQNISQAAQLLSSQVVFWGTPDDPAHDDSRGWECLSNAEDQWGEVGPCTPLDDHSPTAMLTLPTACTPLQASMTGRSWPTGEPGNEGEPLAPEHTTFESPYALTGCESLAFDPSLTIEPESQSASTPTGVNVAVQMPQAGLTVPEGDAEAALKQTTVTLPPGLELSPAAATALQACSAGEFDLLDTFGQPFGAEGVPEEAQTGNETSPSGPADCPDASKVGTVSITTPLLGEPVIGSVFLARQNTNPFKTPLALYLLAEAPQAGVRVKLAGEVQVNQSTGQLVSTFRNTPELPFTSLHIHFFGGERASLTTPPVCGPATTTSEFVPWSAEAATHLESTFQVTAGAGGGPCPPTPLSFSPSFRAGPTSPLAGSFSPLVVDIGRPDGDQPLSGISVTLPAGFAAVLASVTPCPDPPVGQEWSCGEDSHIGEVREYAGLGTEPLSLTGEAYLTTGYDGAPFGLLVRTLAAAGPFNLGWVDVRNRINVNPSTAQVTVTSDPGPRGEAIPTILDGVPVQLKALEVAANRPDFDFNPTNCEPLTTTAALGGSEGASANVSAPFKADGCAGLPFHPTLEASTAGKTSKAAGASLDVKVTSQGLGVANIQKVFLTIPKILPSRLQPTLQHACLAAVFQANPAGCDEDSVIGYATVHTPILKTPLTGPAYVVSHGGAAFPDVEFVLEGEGITLVLDGKTDIKKGVTYSRFESAPDAPFTSFETVLPEGPHSVLAVNTEEAPNYNLCGHNITIPTTITAQDGAVIEQTTKVAVTGCGGVKAYKATSAQLLAKALKACKKKKPKSKRVACEKAARKRYDPKKKTHKAKKAANHSGKR